METICAAGKPVYSGVGCVCSFCTLLRLIWCLPLFQWEKLSEIKTLADRQAACDELFRSEADEYSLFEAVKFLMLNTAIKLHEDNEKGKEVPMFSWLLFARDTSSNPAQLMKNHLNQLGHTGGLEQVSLAL